MIFENYWKALKISRQPKSKYGTSITSFLIKVNQHFELSSQLIMSCNRKLDKMERKIKKLEEEIMKLNFKKIEKEENKTIAMDTSKINYLDPRISVSW